MIAGITHALAGIGADPGGLANPFHGKNPLCPLYSTEGWNETRFPTLADWAAHVDLSARASETLAGPAKRGEILHGSNSTARTLFGWAVQTLREAHGRDDPDYQAGLDDRAALGRYLADALRRDAVLHLGWDDEAGLQSQCARIAERWDVARLARRKNRGVLKRSLAPDASLCDRQRAGQAHTAQRRRDASLEAICAALEATDGTPTQSGIARATGLARSTVARHWQTALASLSHSVLRKKGNVLTRARGTAPSRTRPRPVARAQRTRSPVRLCSPFPSQASPLSATGPTRICRPDEEPAPTHPSHDGLPRHDLAHQTSQNPRIHATRPARPSTYGLRR